MTLNTPNLVGTSAFDASDRMTASTLTYDLLGRVTTLPEELSPVATPLTFDYYTNNLIHSTTNALRNTTDTYTLDPAQRLTCTRTSPVGASDTTSCGNTTTNTDTTNHYTNETSDSPAWTIEKTGTTTTTTFNATNLDGTLSATITGTTITHHIADLRGNTTLTTSSSLAQATTTSYTEYGTPQTPQTPTNAWHGAQQRTTSATTGLIHMGVRLYNSLTGLFLQQDPVHGGNPNTYTHPVDPINQMDLTGKFDLGKWWESTKKSASKAWNNLKQNEQFWKGLGIALSVASMAACVGLSPVCIGVQVASIAVAAWQERLKCKKCSGMQILKATAQSQAFSIGFGAAGSWLTAFAKVNRISRMSQFALYDGLGPHTTLLIGAHQAMWSGAGTFIDAKFERRG